jgi:flagellar biosynthesis/type III secretory pathway M-ring protein FliF/YscJ
VSLWVLRSMARAGTADMQSASVLATRLSAEDDSATEDEPITSIPLRRRGGKRAASASNLPGRNELSEIVRQDPNAAAHIVRTWIGN